MSVHSDTTDGKGRPLQMAILFLTILAFAAIVRFSNLGYNSLNHGETDRLADNGPTDVVVTRSPSGSD